MSGQGREAIERALDEHRRTTASASDASAAADPVRFTGREVAGLAEVVAHWHPAPPAGGPEGHWHFVTLGLSELDDKISPDPARSGWGLELTLRAPGPPDTPPRWPVRVLQQLAAYVTESRNPFGPGHHMDLGTGLDEEVPALDALAFARDPELGTIETPNGAVTFVQAVGLHADEAARAARGSVRGFLEALADRTPLLVTRPDRPSFAGDPALAGAFAATDQPLTAITSTLSWRKDGLLRRRITVSLGDAAQARRNLPPFLTELVASGRTIRILGEGRVLELRRGTTAHWDAGIGHLDVSLPAAVASALLAFLSSSQRSFTDERFPSFALNLIE
jgi:hypothetical protein